MMTAVVAAWYAPVLILAARDPLVRGIVVEAGGAASACAARAAANAVYRVVAFALRNVRRLRHSDEWVVVEAE